MSGLTLYLLRWRELLVLTSLGKEAELLTPSLPAIAAKQGRKRVCLTTPAPAAQAASPLQIQSNSNTKCHRRVQKQVADPARARTHTHTHICSNAQTSIFSALVFPFSAGDLGSFWAACGDNLTCREMSFLDVNNRYSVSSYFEE